MPAGRPLKNGVDYFPLDVICDDKIELIEAEHGIQGFGILIKIYQKIYANNYWIKWDKKAILVFSNRINVDISSINAIINSCIEWKVFNKKLYNEFKILTSSGIQKRFFEIVKRRKVVEVCEDFLLIKLEINAYNNLINVDHNQQRKGKGKESKGNIDTNVSCPESQNDPEQPDAILQIPLIKKDGVFLIYQNDIDQWQESFPGVDAMTHLKTIRQWNIDNPTRRKTKSGIRTHISNWLAKEQNRTPGRNNKKMNHNNYTRSERNALECQKFLEGRKENG